MFIFFFFKQKTAYEIMPSLVGSEMCIRGRNDTAQPITEGGGTKTSDTNQPSVSDEEPGSKPSESTDNPSEPSKPDPDPSKPDPDPDPSKPVSYTHLRAHETRHDLVCRLLLEKKKHRSPS